MKQYTSNDKAHELALAVQQEKSRKAFDDLAREIKVLLIKFVYGHVRRRDHAMPLMGDVLRRLYRSLLAGKYRGETFYKWLHLLVRSEAEKFYRPVRNKHEDLQQADDITDAVAGGELFNEELYLVVSIALNKLTARQKFIVEEHYLNERGYADIGAELGGLSEDSIRSQCSKAVSRLITLLPPSEKRRALRSREKKSAERRLETMRPSVYVDRKELLNGSIAELMNQRKS